MAKGKKRRGKKRGREKNKRINDDDEKIGRNNGKNEKERGKK